VDFHLPFDKCKGFDLVSDVCTNETQTYMCTPIMMSMSIKVMFLDLSHEFPDLITVISHRDRHGTHIIESSSCATSST